jgi:hypothetical protein
MAWGVAAAGEDTGEGLALGDGVRLGFLFLLGLLLLGFLLGFLLLLFRGLFLEILKRLLLVGALLPFHKVAGTVEVDLSVDEGHETHGPATEWVMGPDREVAVPYPAQSSRPHFEMPSWIAGLSVTILSASSSGTPPYFTALAASS